MRQAAILSHTQIKEARLEGEDGTDAQRQRKLRERENSGPLVPQKSFSKLGFIIFPYKCTSNRMYFS